VPSEVDILYSHKTALETFLSYQQFSVRRINLFMNSAMTVFKPGLTFEIATLTACCTFICSQMIKNLLHTYRTLQRESVFVTFSIICTQACTMFQNSGRVTIWKFCCL